MVGQHSSLAHQRPWFAPGAKQYAASVQPAPTQNRLLAALPTVDYQRLLPALQLVPLPLGWHVHCAGDTERYVYFPVSGVVSRYCVLKDGLQAGYALVGYEGAVGVASFMSGVSTPSHAVVLSAGHAYRAGTDVLRSEFERVGALSLLLLRFVQAWIAEISLTAVCNRFHSVEQQLCRRLLSFQDRLPGHDMALTQEAISELLGVRREAITEAAGTLRAAGIVGYSRGHIRVLDRAQLETRACECYRVVRQEYDRLLRDSAVIRGNALHLIT